MEEHWFEFRRWAGAKFIDWWTFIHILCGISIAIPLRITGASLWLTIAIASFIFIPWEICEKLAHVPEPWLNTITDLVLEYTALVLVYTHLTPIPTPKMVGLAILVPIIWAVLNYWGWRCWKASLQSSKAKTQN